MRQTQHDSKKKLVSLLQAQKSFENSILSLLNLASALKLIASIFELEEELHSYIERTFAFHF